MKCGSCGSARRKGAGGTVQILQEDGTLKSTIVCAGCLARSVPILARSTKCLACGAPSIYCKRHGGDVDVDGVEALRKRVAERLSGMLKLAEHAGARDDEMAPGIEQALDILNAEAKRLKGAT